ncbi:MAG: M20/M25/M40 family metallo-hydrolase [Myxococcota bacterium]
MLLLSTPVLAADPVVADLLARGEAQTEAWEELVELCDDIGPRLSGSKNLDRAVRWAARRMEQDGLEVEVQPVEVPHWERGAESARILAPVSEPLQVLGLGMTAPTPAGGITAPVVVARDWAALEALGENVRGKIVLLDPVWKGYGETVGYRIAGADEAAKHGALAVLLRSVTDASLNTPHTGTLHYDGELKLPAAAITPEAADRIRRWSDRARMVEVHLELESVMHAPAPSANVVGSVKGSEKPDEVVLLGCHLDSWDVGTGAQDDGAACVAVMEAVALVASAPKKPKRTVRAALFTNEENGTAGGEAYVEANRGLTHVALIESDTGMGGTLGFRVDAGLKEPEPNLAAGAKLVAPMAELLAPLETLGITTLEPGYAGADVGPWLDTVGGVGLGVLHDMSEYWKIHHTHADTVDKIDPANLQKEVAALAAAAWILANADEIPGSGPREKAE